MEISLGDIGVSPGQVNLIRLLFAPLAVNEL
jgi:hypothetical protein